MSDTTHHDAGQTATGHANTGHTDTAALAAIITNTTKQLVALGGSSAAADAFADGLHEDAVEHIEARLAASLNLKTAASLAAIAKAACREMRERGVPLNPVMEDEIDEAITELEHMRPRASTPPLAAGSHSVGASDSPSSSLPEAQS